MKTHPTTKTSLPVVAAVLLSGLSLGAANTNQWETSAAAGLTLTRGNSETLLGNLTLNSSRKWPRDEVLLGASATYGEQTTEQQLEKQDGTKIPKDVKETTTANAGGFGQYNHLFTDEFYGGLRLSALHDSIADVEYRVTISPLVGYYVIKNPKTQLAFEAGPSLVFEKQGRDQDEYVALRFAERFEHKFSDKAKMWQSVEYLPQIDEFHNYIVNFEIGAEASLTEKLSLRGVIQDNYDNDPAPGRKNNDIKLITSLVYKF
jgi:putative salt-induced outer membrane protein YdiY